MLDAAAVFDPNAEVADDVISANSCKDIDTVAPLPPESVLSIVTSGGASIGAFFTNLGFGGVIVERNTFVRVSDEIPTVVRFWAAEPKLENSVRLLKPVPPKLGDEPKSGPLVNVVPPLSPSAAIPAVVTLVRIIAPVSVSLM